MHTSVVSDKCGDRKTLFELRFTYNGKYDDGEKVFLLNIRSEHALILFGL